MKSCDSNCIKFLKKNQQIIENLNDEDFCTYIKRYLKHYWPILINNITKEDMLKIKELAIRLYIGEEEEIILEEWHTLQKKWTNNSRNKVITFIEHEHQRV